MMMTTIVQLVGLVAIPDNNIAIWKISRNAFDSVRNRITSHSNENTGTVTVYFITRPMDISQTFNRFGILKRCMMLRID